MIARANEKPAYDGEELLEPDIVEDILPKEYDAKQLAEDFEQAYYHKKGKQPSLFCALVKLHWRTFVLHGVLACGVTAIR